MSNRKQGSNNTVEVSGARTKLDDVLKDLVEKAEESQAADEQLATKLEDGSFIKQEPEDDYPSVPDPQPKRAQKSRKRRKRELPTSHIDHDLLDSSKLQHSYVMKLFDRSVDLATFKSTSSLYPVCREWLKNDPSSRQNRAPEKVPVPSPEPEDKDQDDEDNPIPNIYKLPPPSTLASELCLDGLDPRIPSPVPQPTEELNIHLPSDQAPARNVVLSNHIERWKQCKQKWKEAAQSNQMRYSESYTLLKAMYDSDRQ